MNLIQEKNMKVKSREGALQEACILAIRGGMMRVAVQGFDDATEFNLINGDWISEEGQTVEFGFSFGSYNSRPRYMTAGQAMPDYSN